ncbi:hypothetical protein KI387_027898, partial [Taxus chinensis]
MVIFMTCNKFGLTEAQKVPAVFMFGDSYGDTGNNDFITTLVKANFLPYGRDFNDHIPTGRFSNGKLMSDYFAEGLGIKESLPPYLDPKLQHLELPTGVCFGSAGTGLDNLTAQILGVIPFWKQIDHFKDYKKKLVGLVGEEQATTILEAAIFFSVIGTNDFSANYYLVPIRPFQFTIQQYTYFLLGIYRDYIMELYNLDARRIAVINVPPLGCLPLERTIGFFISKGACVEERNVAAAGFNTGLNAMILDLKSALHDIRIVTLDYNNLISEFILNPSKYGFEVVAQGCCGTGTFEVAFLCNKLTPFTCLNVSKYVFFYAIHLTQRAYKIISN